mgnify:CR=1 FL=1
MHPIPVALGLLLAAPAAARPAGGCADHLHVVIDSGSIRAAARPQRIDEAQLEALRLAAGAQLRDVANGLCRTRVLDPRRLAGRTQLVVLQGSGATEPFFFEPAGAFGGTALAFQYGWAQSGLALPGRAAVGRALACWSAGTCASLD